MSSHFKPQGTQFCAKSVLVISHDIVGAKMAGPGIRYYQLARVLAQTFPVVLAAPGAYTADSVENLYSLAYSTPQDPALEKAIRQAQVIIVPAVHLSNFPALLDSTVPLVIDGYDPFLTETLFLDPANVENMRRVLARAYLAGDFFICASERQRDWWLGLLEAHGRINSYTFQDDMSLRKLVDVVPFGVPTGSPSASCNVFKGKLSGIQAHDKVILWGGGLWKWLDPLTAIRAMVHVWSGCQDARLIFPGTRHPNPSIVEKQTWTQKALAVAQETGLLDRAIFFGDWVPYSDWPAVLMESDLALSLHYDTLETRLAFRTRILDYLWAGLPMIVTQGDELSELVERHQLGIVVDYEDERAVADAILKLLTLPKVSFEQRFVRVRQALTWEQAAKPLIEFCYYPRCAPDKAALGLTKGHSFYLGEIERLRSLVDGYERGRFMRFTRWLHRIRQRWAGQHK